VDIKQSNSMVEASNSVLKHQYLYSQCFQTIEQLEKRMRFFQADFGNRPHGGLYGTTPFEALKQEQIPDSKRFKNKISEERRKRIDENQKFNCNKCQLEQSTAL